MLTKKQIAILREVRRLATLETASFRSVGPATDPLPADERDVDKFIKDRTRIHRETWILPPLDRMIEEAEREHANRKK